MYFNEPIGGASERLVKRLGKEYLLSTPDVVWMNYVHLVCMTMVTKITGKTYVFYVLEAIRRLTVDMKYEHCDPYGLWIDAGFIDPDLNELKEEDALF